MNRARVYLRNVAANWVGYGLNLVVLFFLQPFVVHSLGDTAYGVWSLLVSLTGYLGLIELGTRGGLGRFTNFYLGRGEIDKVNGVMSTALAFFLVCGILLFLVAAGLAACFGLLFRKVPPELTAVARPAILLIALNLWLSFVSAAFRQILVAFERFDVSNALDLAVLAVRATSTVVALKNGGGIISLAFIQAGTSLLGVAGAYLLSRKVFPELRLGASLVSLLRFRELFGFSLWVFVSSIAMNLLWWTDSIVITILLGPAMVTYYAIPLALIDYSRGVMLQFSRVLGPQTIKASSVGDYQELRHIFKWGSTVNMYLAIPLLMGMIFLGPEFIRLWMGQRYERSGSILILLALPQLVVMATRIGGGIIIGLGYVRFGALLTLLQGVTNLGLTLLFVMRMGMGLEGVALGTLIPMVLFNIVGVQFILGWIRFPVSAFVRHNVVRYVLCAVAFGSLCLAAKLICQTPNWRVLALKVIALGVVFLPLGFYLLFDRNERRMLYGKVSGLFPRAETAE